MKSQCYFQKLIGGNVEAIVQISEDKAKSKMKVILTKEFGDMFDAQCWWKENRENIKLAVGRMKETLLL